MARNINISKAPIIVQDAVLSQIREGIVRARLTTARSRLDLAEYQSYLNTPVYGSFTFGDLDNPSANNYVDQFGVTKSFTPLRFHECTFQIAQSKNIITTPLQGYNGTIKEYVSDGDFEISIDGQLSGIFNSITKSFSDSSLYPEAYVQDLVRAIKVPSAIPITNNILSTIFDVNYVVVTNYSFPRNTAGMNYQKFKLDLISDRPIEIILSEGDLDNNQKLSDLLTG
jgi:hypothetical protein